MKRVMAKHFSLILMVSTIAIAASAVSADVYKVVDENGNVTYTDRQPPDGSGPVKLAPISVIETPVYEKPAKAETEEGSEISLRDLRRNYADFAIVAPRQEESVWHPQEAMTIAWNTRYQLQDGMQVTIYVDGRQQSKTTNQSIEVEQLERGEHKVEAQLTDAKNRRIATAEPVIFFVRRPGLNNNVARPTPRGG